MAPVRSRRRLFSRQAAAFIRICGQFGGKGHHRFVTPSKEAPVENINSQFQMSRATRSNMVGGAGLLIFGLLALISLPLSMVSVDAGYRGVKQRFGKVVGSALTPGLHFKLPIVETIQPVEVREQKLNLDTSASSKDLQTVQSRIVVNFHPEPAKVSELYENIGLEYQSRILDPAVEETVKAITAQYTAEELISKRTEVRQKMEEMLKERVSVNAIGVTKFNIVNFEFSHSFNEAIEAKQTAEQKALQASNELRRVEVEAEQQIEKARGRAESLKLEAQAEADAVLMKAEAEAKAQEMLARVVNRDVINLRAIEKWDGIMPRVTGDVVPFLSVDADDASGVQTNLTAAKAR